MNAGPTVGRARRTSGRPVLRASGLGKTFERTNVLRDVGLEIRSGEVRALLGQNGSGKSTLIKLLGGYHAPDPGARLELRGERVALPVRARDASRLGLSIMHQDLGLDESASVIDNFLLRGGAHPRPLGRIRWRRERLRTAAVLHDFDLDVDVDAPAGELSRTERAVLAMARAVDRLGDEPGVLVLDEPTTALEPSGIEHLFAAMRQVGSRGAGVLFVTHDLQEALAVSDEVTVLRDGAKVAEGPVREFDESALVEAIVGREIGDLYPPAASTHPGRPLLRARDLSGRVLRGVGFDLHEGEVLGLCGLAGMGQDEVPGLIFGSTPVGSGEVALDGADYQPSPVASLRRGLVLVPGDRHREGGDMSASVGENLTLPVLRRFVRRGTLDRGAERIAVDEVLERFRVRPPDATLPLGRLSGGNQQKALLGKWLSLFGEPRILLLHEPTQGVDVGARQEIFNLIRKSAESGTAVLYVSTECDDLAHLCDRVLVLRHGGIVAEVGRDHLSGPLLAGLCHTATATA